LSERILVKELYTLSANPPKSIGKRLNQAMSRTATSHAHKASRTFWSAAGTGFGKGALIVAGIVLLGAMTIGALTGVSPEFDPSVPLGLAESQSFGAGLTTGLMSGIDFLLRGAGLATMIVGGTIGAVADVRARQNDIELEMAQQNHKIRETTQALDLANAPQLQQSAALTTPAAQVEHVAPEPQPQRPHFANAFERRCADTPELSYCARELDRRSQATASSHVKGGVA